MSVNKCSKWWLLTWNWPIKEWKNGLLHGHIASKFFNREYTANIVNRIVRIVATKEVAANGMPHIHAVIEFDKVVYLKTLRKYYNNVAHFKPLKKDYREYLTPIEYIFKGEPVVDDVLFYPNHTSWFQYNYIFNYLQLS